MSTWAASVWRAVAARLRTTAHGGRPGIAPGSVLVTGSSGKGTTCRMLASIVKAAGHRPIEVIEVEPGSAPRFFARVPDPAALVCTNVLCGEPDDDVDAAAVTAGLERAIRSLPASTTLILNADDPRVAGLAPDVPNPRLYFGVADPLRGRVRPDPTADVPRCPRCHGQLSYSCVFYAHLGHWACRACGLRRPETDISIANIRKAGPRSSRIRVVAAAGETELRVPLPGVYNAYNALAALAVAAHLRLPAWSLPALENVSAIPMRMERICVAGHDVRLTVATNASAYTEVLRAVLGNGEPRRMLLGLSGREWSHSDCSWIWDVDFESVAGLVPAPVVCGNRAADLAVRLKYAGWFGGGQDQGESAGARIEPDPVRAVRAAIAGAPPGEPLWIVSTVAALAEIRRWLHRHDDGHDPQRESRGRARVRQRAAIRPAGQPVGPQPSGPPRAAPQPTAPPVTRRQPARRRSRGSVGRGQSGWPGQSGAAR
jgi:UDP-N-acetylmuramyl tripeptide synthase